MNLHGESPGWWCCGCKSVHLWSVDRWYAPDGYIYCEHSYPKKAGEPHVVNDEALQAKLCASSI